MALDYKQAGVDIDAGDALVSRIGPLAAKTFRQGVMTGLGGFGALFHLGNRYRDPVLVSGTDGAGTKVKLACQWHRHQGIGQDLVAMCVNDILVQGAEPLFFLDYFACSKLDVDVAAEVIASIARGCTLANCALVGGETAEMPGIYTEGEYDLAGFAVGAVEKNEVIDGTAIAPGDVILGLPSSGPHANGFSLIRRILQHVTNPETLIPPGMTTCLLDALMAPTQIYVRPVLSLMKKIPLKGMAHITGGGLPGNIPRVLPRGCRARLHRENWPASPLFDWLQREGDVARNEMYRVFNAGIGYVLVLAADHLQAAQSHLATDHQDSYPIGEIVAGDAASDVELIFSQ